MAAPALTLILAGAALADDAGTIPDGTARQGTLTSAGSFYVEWWTEPDPIPRNELFVIHFRVLDPERRETPVAGAVVTAGAWMPDHNHGTNLQPRLESHGDGTATARGFLLHMEGNWELRVGVAAKGQMERASFAVRLGP